MMMVVSQSTHRVHACVHTWPEKPLPAVALAAAVVVVAPGGLLAGMRTWRVRASSACGREGSQHPQQPTRPARETPNKKRTGCGRRRPRTPPPPAAARWQQRRRQQGPRHGRVGRGRGRGCSRARARGGGGAWSGVVVGCLNRSVNDFSIFNPNAIDSEGMDNDNRSTPRTRP